jgi:hypothetical protein
VKTLELRYPSRDALVEDWEQHLQKGRAFVHGAAELAVREPCGIVVIHPETNDQLALPAEAVWIDASGVGLELVGFDAAKQEELGSFVASRPNAAPSGPASGPPAEPPLEPRARHAQERVRNLSPRERFEVARHGTLSERVALERVYGNAVWESLLENPQITPPEVARIAKMGTLTKPLVGVILAHGGWLAAPEVQRALLSNPRCNGPDLDRVLRAVRPAELTRLAQQCPYRAEVRAAAQRLARK